MRNQPAPEAPFAKAIRTLRVALGETQEGMARRLGISLSGYRYWESGHRTPRGRWLLRLRELCPDPETRGLFGGPTQPAPGEGARPQGQSPAAYARTPWDAYRDGALRAIYDLHERAAMGDAAAQERLRHIFAEATARAGSGAETKQPKRPNRRR